MYTIAFFGKFNSGKSTLINSILGRKVVPEYFLPTHLPVIFIEYGDQFEIQLVNSKAIIKQQIRSIEDIEKKNDLSEVKKIIIRLNHNYLLNGLRIIDTPGIDDVDHNYVDYAINFLKDNYNVINEAYYLVANSALTKTDLNFLKELVQKVNNVTVLFSKADRESPEDALKVIKELENKLYSELGKSLPVLAVSPKLIFRDNITTYFLIKINNEIQKLYLEKIFVKNEELLYNLKFNIVNEIKIETQFLFNQLRENLKFNKNELVNFIRTEIEAVEHRLNSKLNDKFDITRGLLNDLSNTITVSENKTITAIDDKTKNLSKNVVKNLEIHHNFIKSKFDGDFNQLKGVLIKSNDEILQNLNNSSKYILKNLRIIYLALSFNLLLLAYLILKVHNLL